MYLYEYVIVCIFLVPAIFFLFILLLNVLFALFGKRFHKLCSKLVLRIMGWNQVGTVEYSKSSLRWRAGAAFILLYGSILFKQLGVILLDQSTGIVILFVVTLMLAVASLIVFIGCYYSCSVLSEGKLFVVPLKIWASAKIPVDDTPELVVQDGWWGSCFLLSSQWRGKRLVLLNREQLEKILGCR